MHVFTVCPVCGDRFVLRFRPGQDPADGLFGRCDGCGVAFRLYGGHLDAISAVPPERGVVADAS